MQLYEFAVAAAIRDGNSESVIAVVSLHPYSSNGCSPLIFLLLSLFSSFPRKPTIDSLHLSVSHRAVSKEEETSPRQIQRELFFSLKDRE